MLQIQIKLNQLSLRCWLPRLINVLLLCLGVNVQETSTSETEVVLLHVYCEGFNVLEHHTFVEVNFTFNLYLIGNIN